MPFRHLASVTGVAINNRAWKIVALLTILFVLFYKLGAWGVLDTSEARYAEIGRVMFESGDLIHPRYLGIEHYHKPPLTYWITALSHSVWGVSAFSARFFLQIAFILQIILIFQIAILFWDDRSKAWISAMSYGSMLIVLISIRNLTTDAYLTTWIMGTLWALIYYARKQSILHVYLAGIFAGMAFLTKITAALFYIGPMSLLVIWYYKESWKWTVHIAGAIILFLGVSLSWFLLLELEGKQILRYVFYDQSLVRYRSDAYNRSMPFYFYLLLAPVLCFPWLPMLMDSSVGWIKNGKHRKQLIWILVSILFPILFFSISRSKLLLYILPLFWNVALLVPLIFETINPVRTGRWYTGQSIFYILILLALIITPIVSNDVNAPVGMYLWMLSGCGFMTWIARRKSIPMTAKVLHMSLVFASMIVLMAPHYLRANELNASTAKPVADWLVQEDMEDRKVLVYNKYAPSLSFHLGKVCGMISRDVRRELQWEEDESWKQYYFPLENQDPSESLEQLLNRENCVLVVRRRRVGNVSATILNKFADQNDIGIWSVFY